MIRSERAAEAAEILSDSGAPVMIDAGRFFGPPRGRICVVALHGYLVRRSFPQRCALHLLDLPVLYPESLRPQGNWTPRDAEAVARLGNWWRMTTGARRLIVAGFSDGCTPLHAAADLCDADGLIHYAGIFSRATRPVLRIASACVFVSGRRDRTPMPRHTRRAAKAYGRPVRRVPGRHRWNREENLMLMNMVAGGFAR